ncbi:zinc knuckle CX2CX4HX4C containing protein [Tanacetum coccineum]
MRCTGHGDLSSALVLRTVLDEFSLNSGHHPRMERVHGIHSHACANEEENVNVDMVNSDANNVTKMGPTPAGNTSGMSLYANITGVPSRKALNFHTLFTLRGNGVDVVVLVESNRAISDQFANMAYMIFSFQFSSMDGLDAMLENGPWSSYARALIEVLANVELKVNIMVAMPKLVGEDFYTCTVCVDYEWKPPSCARCKVCSHVHAECPKNIDSDVVKNMKKPGQALRGVPVGPKDLNVLGMERVHGIHSPSYVNEEENVNAGTVNSDAKNVTKKGLLRPVILLFANTAYMLFLEKRMAYLVVANSVRNTWGKFGLVKSMLNSSTRIISFQFSSMDGLDAMLENGPWFIRNNLLILKKWNLKMNLLNEDVGNVSVWVKHHGVPMTAFSEDGLSAIATKLGTPLMLDS